MFIVPLKNAVNCEKWFYKQLCLKNEPLYKPKTDYRKSNLKNKQIQKVLFIFIFLNQRTKWNFFPPHFYVCCCCRTCCSQKRGAPRRQLHPHFSESSRGPPKRGGIKKTPLTLSGGAGQAAEGNRESQNPHSLKKPNGQDSFSRGGGASLAKRQQEEEEDTRLGAFPGRFGLPPDTAGPAPQLRSFRFQVWPRVCSVLPCSQLLGVEPSSSGDEAEN